MGRARRSKSDTVPNRGWPPELLDLQRRGGMSSEWHTQWHGRGQGLGPIKHTPKDDIDRGDIATCIYFLLWKSQDPNCQPLRFDDTNIKISEYTEAANCLAGKQLGREIKAVFEAWKQSNLDLYQKVLHHVSTEDLIYAWGALASSDYNKQDPSPHLRPIAFRNLALEKDLKKSLELSVPSLYIRLQGELQGSLENASWRLLQRPRYGSS